MGIRLGRGSQQYWAEKGLVNYGQMAETERKKVALSVSQEEPSDIGMGVQPLRDKLIPHFCVKFVGECLLSGSLLPSTLGGRARQQSVNDFLEMWHMKLRLR